MSILRSKDLKAALDTIDAVYCAREPIEVFRAICESLRKTIGIAIAGCANMPLEILFKVTPDENSIYLLNATHTLAEDFMRFGHLDPRIQNNHHLRINIAAKTSDYSSLSKLKRSAYGQEVMLKNHFGDSIDATLGIGKEMLSIVCFNREWSDRPYTERHKAILNLVAPHAARAIYHIGLKHNLLDGDIGVIDLDAYGAVSSMNDYAKKYLGGAPPDKLLSHGANDGSCFFNTAKGSYKIRVIHAPKSRGCERTILLEPMPSANGLKAKLSALGLSPRQAEVAALVIQGLSNQEIAERLFIAEHTVKVHLKDIFEKTRIKRRSELAAMVMSGGFG